MSKFKAILGLAGLSAALSGGASAAPAQPPSGPGVKSVSYTVPSSQADLKIDTSCLVRAVAAAEPNKVSLKLTADPDTLKEFKFQQSGAKVSAVQESAGAGGLVVNNAGGAVVISGVSGGNLSVVNGKVFVNGVEVKPNSRPAQKQCELEVSVPRGSDLDIKLSGNAQMDSAVPFNNVSVDLSGVSKAHNLTGTNLDGHVEGQSSLTAKTLGGRVRIDVSGQSSATVTGQFNDVDANVSGQSSLVTVGPVKADYRADSSGQSKITHSGGVKGRIRDRASGQSSNTIN